AGGVLEAMFGHFDEARRLGAEARARTEEFGESMSITAHRAEKLWMVEMLAGDAVAAEREIRRGFELLERAGERAGCRRRPPSSRGDARRDLAEVLRLAGRTQEAADAARSALSLYEQKGNVVMAGRARAVLDELVSATERA